jgi:hypothetical protein
MLRSEEFQEMVLYLLMNGGPALSHRLTSQDVTPEKYLGKFGRADLVIDVPDTIILLEVKHSARCARTKRQRAGDYEKYLKLQPNQQKWLVYLVPEGWDKKEQTKKELTAIRSDGTINTNLVTWETFYNRLARLRTETPGPMLFVQEFRSLLIDRFGPITFTEQEVRKMLDPKLSEYFSTVRGLQLIVDNLETKVRKSYKGKCNTNREDEQKHSEYGFYVQCGSSDVLWVGIWTEVVTKLGIPISFGFQDSWKSARHYLGARSPDREMPPDFETVGGDWWIYAIPKEVFESGGPDGEIESRIWNLLQPTLRALTKL